MTIINTEAYPPKPQHADKNIIKPSTQFNKRVAGMLGAILLFIVAYILIFIATLAIAASFILFAYFLVFKIHFYWLSFIFSVALVASGLLLIFFLIKFLFKLPAKSPPAFMEATAHEHPQLFAFIKKVTDEVGVPFPKHIYLDHDVNASVFYTSTFWSMFLPVPKNLRIGLGLVNSLNKSEFKAVLAHEFGHFSQRSMKFGSYVYNLNKVLYNMLYDNDQYKHILESWSNSFSYFKITSVINVNLIKGIQHLLQKVYTVINKSHMRLSREMEFQADAISAYNAGANQTISCLRRIEVGSSCYDELLRYWTGKLNDKKRGTNFYANHKEWMICFAERYNLKTDEIELPVIDKQLAVLSNSQLYIDNQWSSHPQLHEREDKLSKLNIDTDTVKAPAWQLFSNYPQLQVKATNILYELYGDTTNFAEISDSEFTKEYRAETFEFSNDAFYKGYYDNRIIEIEEIEPEKPGFEVNHLILHDLFSDEKCNIPKLIEGIRQDMNLLHAAKENEDISTFDYKGLKYEMDSADSVIEQMNAEILDNEALLKAHDQLIYTCIYHVADDTGKRTLKSLYNKLKEKQQAADQVYELYNKLAAAIQPVYTTMQFADIEETLAKVAVIEEDLKNNLKEITNNEELANCIRPTELACIDEYTNGILKYFDGNSYLNENLDKLNQVSLTFVNIINRHVHHNKQNLLNFQIQYLKPNN